MVDPATSPPPIFHLALVHPEIPQNAGNVGRMCLGVGAKLHLVHPLGFSTSESAVRRAGLDYWKHVDVMEHTDLDAFWTWVGDRRVWCFSSHGPLAYTRAPYAVGDVLVFGRESVGLPEALLAGRDVLHIPMTGPTRSLNLSNAAAVVAYAALARIRPELF
ncbi:MAG: tRNA (cytidine(34)-2'-O)-methyltransferase [Pseudomonadota bacterium]|nr:tRNA (cytidine(34)-2'-O)-methyltransferase [Pseudomonadota bacterium]